MSQLNKITHVEGGRSCYVQIRKRKVVGKGVEQLSLSSLEDDDLTSLNMHGVERTSSNQTALDFINVGDVVETLEYGGSDEAYGYRDKIFGVRFADGRGVFLDRTDELRHLLRIPCRELLYVSDGPRAYYC